MQLHDKMLYNIQVRLNQLNFNVAALQDLVQYTIYSNNMLFDANIVSNRLITGLIVLRNNVEQIYKYLRVIASQEDTSTTFKGVTCRGGERNGAQPVARIAL